MSRTKTCIQCGLPYKLGKAHVWNSNGTITERKDPGHRMLFLESENFDPLFAKIEEMIGVPIGHIVQESKRKVTRQYLEGQLPRMVRRTTYAVRPRLIMQMMADITRCLGLGDVQVVEARHRKEGTHFARLSIEYPYSLLLFLGDTSGGMEAASGRECVAESARMTDKQDKHIISLQLGEHSPELAERLQSRTYKAKPGDIAYERCLSCGVPLEIAEYQWSEIRGTIIHPMTRRRSVITGSGGLEAIFEELERELGEEVSEVVIEEQRAFTRETFRGDSWPDAEYRLRRMLALRGLGLLTLFSRRGRELDLVIQNACVPLLTVGMVKGLYELASNSENSAHTWSLTADGDLNICITSGSELSPRRPLTGELDGSAG